MSGEASTRAISMTRAVPEALSLTACPSPLPSMCAPRMYISCGAAAPTFRGVDLLAWFSLVFVVETLRLIAPTPQLLLDPIDRARVPFGPLLPVPELREPVDEYLVGVEIEPRDDRAGHAVFGGHRDPSENPGRDGTRTGRLPVSVPRDSRQERRHDEHVAGEREGQNTPVTTGR